MSCNSCAKGFSIIRQEKGCPACGFSFCSKCLNNKIFLPKLNTEAKVCAKCERLAGKRNNENQTVVPPDAYYKSLATAEDKSARNMSSTSSTTLQSIDDQILARLKNLKNDNAVKVSSEEEITKRLQDVKGTVQPPSDVDISNRLAKLKGIPVIVSKPSLPVRDLRTEQQQAEDLLKQYVEQTQIDTKYKDVFDSLVGDIESRMQKLKGTSTPLVEVGGTSESNINCQDVESEDEEETVKKIVERIKAEASIEEGDIPSSTHDALPFCEICNEDATMRCLGCRYLFCKRCFLDHKDDDDGCNRYETYQPPKDSQY